MSRGEPPKTFSFDQVYAPDSKQVDLYNETARPIVDFVLEGYNGSYSWFSLLHLNNKLKIVVQHFLGLVWLAKGKFANARWSDFALTLLLYVCLSNTINSIDWRKAKRNLS